MNDCTLYKWLEELPSLVLLHVQLKARGREFISRNIQSTRG